MSADCKNPEFELRGIDHLALVCSDMERTIAFYGDVLGMPLVENIELPGARGNHFIFEIGKGVLLTFFWFGNEPKVPPVMARPRRHHRDRIHRPNSNVADCSMYHLAFNVPAEKIDNYLERLQAKGIQATIVNYDRTAHRHSDSVTENTLGRSIYFTDPDGVVLEFAASAPSRDIQATKDVGYGNTEHGAHPHLS